VPVVKNKELRKKYDLEDWDIDLSEAVKVEDMLPDKDIIKDCYYLFKDGGFHPLSQVSKERKDLPEIYRKPVWPWVASLFGNKVKHMTLQLSPSGYAVMRFKKNEKTFFDSQKTEARKKFECSFHTLLAKAFVPNPDPQKKTIVDHIDNNSCNYLITNLQWATPQENSIGGKPIDMDIVLNGFLNTHWFNDPAVTIGMVKEYKTYVKLKPTPQLSLDLNFENTNPGIEYEVE